MTIRLRGLWGLGFELAVPVPFFLARPGVSFAQIKDPAPNTAPAADPPPSSPAPPAASAPVPSPSAAQKTLPDKPLPAGQTSDPSAGSKDRLFYAMPNF